MEFTLYSIIGLVGAFGYLFSYALLQFKRDYAKTLSYSMLNLFSALLVAVSLIKDFNAGSMFIQISWIAISVYGVFRCIKYLFSVKKGGSLQKVQELEKEIEILQALLHAEKGKVNKVDVVQPSKPVNDTGLMPPFEVEKV